MGMKSMSEVEFLLWPEHQRVASRSSHLKQNRNIISEKKYIIIKKQNVSLPVQQKAALIYIVI